MEFHRIAANPIVNLISQGARSRGLDPRAVLAVANQEGLSGRVGDGGHAFGPFQLNNAGGVITGRPGTAAQLQAWAQSPQGINFALDRIAGVAKGLGGPAAVRAIVSRFERPTDPQGEIFRALQGYGSVPNATPVSAGPGLPVPMIPSTQPIGLGSGYLQSVLDQNRLTLGLPSINFGPLAAAAGPRQTAVTAPAGPSVGAAATAPRKSGKSIKWLEHYAAPYGLTVTSTTEGKHVKGSYHYKGRAIDLAGSPDQMRAAAEAALQHPQDFAEMFYDPIGAYIKDGKIVKGAIGGHSDHVHIAR